MTVPLRFEANLSLLFTELPLLERPAAAKAAGFEAVELWWPYPGPVPSERELDDLVDSLGTAGVSLVCLNLDAGDMAGGSRGLASLPGEGQRFADNLACVVALAERTGTRVFSALYGNRLDGVVQQQQDELALERLASAADAAARISATIVLETQNSVDSPRYPLRTAAQAVDVVKSLRGGGHRGIAFLCDLYHLGMEGADLAAVVREHSDVIGHVQVADAPGRHEPGTGSTRFEPVFAALADSDYRGWVGCEYRPTRATTETFGWLAPYARLNVIAGEIANEGEHG